MTLVTGTVQDLGHAPLDGTLYARPARFLPSGNVVYAPERTPYKIEGGTFSVELAPGPAVLELKVGTHARDEFRVVIPDQETIGLADLIAEVFPWQPEQVSKFVAERELAVQAKKDAETAAGQASTAAGTATTAAQQTGQDRSHVDQVRALLDETYDESQAGAVLPPRLMESELNATYGADAWEDPDSEVRQIAKTKFVGQAKTSRGAAVPEFMRHPTLGVERVWPNTHEDVTLLWTSVDGETVYAQDQGGYFLKSTNGGRTWASRQLIPAQPGGTLRRLGRQGAFLRLKNGTLLSVPRVDNAIGPAMYFARSTDDGVTWTYVDVRTLTAGGTHLGPTSWCEDPTTGYVYYGEYNSSDTQAEVNVYRSTDSGATWSKFHSFPGPTTTHPDKVRHIHSVEWDHIAQRILITTGDPEPAAGIYRVNAAGTGVEPLLLNRQITNAYTHNGTVPFTQSARAIGIMPFPDYIAYAADSQLAALVRVPRSALVTDGVTPVDVEVVKYLNSTAWFAIRASNDGARWVMSASQESASTRIDPAAHLYAVEDQGATIYELGAWLSPSANSWVSISPVGDAQSSGDTFYLRAHNSPRPAAWRCSLLASSGSPLPLPPAELKRAWTWQNFTTPQTTLEPGETLVFGFQRVPAGASALMVYDMGVLRLSGAYGTVARIQSVDGATVYATAGGPSERANLRVAPSDREAFSRAPAPGSDVVFVVHNTSATEPVTALAFITVGWGSFAGDLAG